MRLAQTLRHWRSVLRCGIHVSGCSAFSTSACWAVPTAYSFSAPTIVQTLSGLGITGTGFVVADMSMQGPLWSIATRFLEGRAAAAGIAVINTIGVLGGFVGPYWMGIAKDLTGNYRRGLLTMAVPMLVGAGIMFYLRWQGHQATSPMIGPVAAMSRLTVGSSPNFVRTTTLASRHRSQAGRNGSEVGELR